MYIFWQKLQTEVTTNFEQRSTVFFISSNKVTPFRLIEFPLLEQMFWFFQLPLAVVDIILVLVFHKLHRTLQSTVSDPLGVSEEVTRVSPRKRDVSAQTEMGQD